MVEMRNVMKSIGKGLLPVDPAFHRPAEKGKGMSFCTAKRVGMATIKCENQRFGH
jgi:hypothetical protein